MFNPWMTWKILQKGNSSDIHEIETAIMDRFDYPKNKGWIEVKSNIDAEGRGAITIKAGGKDTAEIVVSFIERRGIHWR